MPNEKRYRVTIDPNDPEEQKIFARQRKYFRLGLLVVIAFLFPAIFLLFAGWVIAAGIAANLAIFSFLWFISRP